MTRLVATVGLPGVFAVGSPQLARTQQNHFAQNAFTSMAQAALQHEATVGVARGLEPAGTIRMGLLLPRERDSLALQLDSGWEYLAIGICDDDCGDLYFYLSDHKGTQVGLDVWSNRRPRVRVRTTSPADYTLRIVMGNCSVPPCYYGVQLFRKPLPS